MATKPTKPTISTPPSRKRPSTFSDEMDAFLSDFQPVADYMENSNNYVDQQLAAAETQAGLAEAEALSAQSFAAESKAYSDDSEVYKSMASASANFKGLWTDLPASLSVPSACFYNGAYWMLLYDVANVSAEEPGVSAAWEEIQLMEIVRTPISVSPISGATSVSPSPELSATAYQNVYESDTRNYREFQLDLASGDFSTPVFSSQVNADSVTVDVTLDFNTTHKWRCRDVATSGEASRWMSVQGFSTGATSIDRPTVSVTGSPSEVPEEPTISTSAFSVTGGTDTHLNTDWQILDDQLAVVWESLADAANLLSIDVPAGILSTSTAYTFRARHRGDTYGASEWGSINATTAAAFFDWGPGDDYDAMVAAGNYDATTDTGYMGLVTSANLCDGPTLAMDIGLSAGVAFNDTAGWLKFYVGPAADCNKDGVAKVVFIAKETIRNNLSWDDIYLAGAVYGTGDNGVAAASTSATATQDAQVTYDGTTYKVRLMTGSATDPAAEAYNNQSCADDAGGGSEWNDLLYRVHAAIPTCTDATIGMDGGYETTRHGGPQDGDNWAAYTNTGLQVYSTDAGDGTFSWCQEQGFDTKRRVLRGGIGVADFYTNTADNATAVLGWRPCLEVVQA